MALRHAALAALLEGEASGYQLAKRFDHSVANFWSATPQQLYRELERLQAGGLVSARLVRQERRPNKRVFSLTEAGRRELYLFTRSPARPQAIRDDVLVKLQALEAGDPEAVAASVREGLARSRAKLAIYERLHERLLDGVSEERFVQRGERLGPYLTLRAGLMYERMSIQWGEQALTALAAAEASSAEV